jgi:hypothetical protein
MDYDNDSSLPDITIDEPGSASRDEGQVVNYYFPVEVVCCGSGQLGPAEIESIQAGVFQDLYDAINRRLA